MKINLMSLFNILYGPKENPGSKNPAQKPFTSGNRVPFQKLLSPLQ
jgi:hypothetical protein